MRIVGKRNIRSISILPSGDLLKEGALFNDEVHKLPTGNTTYFPKGVFRYKSFEDAEAHFTEQVIKGMASNAK